MYVYVMDMQVCYISCSNQVTKARSRGPVPRGGSRSGSGAGDGHGGWPLVNDAISKAMAFMFFFQGEMMVFICFHHNHEWWIFKESIIWSIRNVLSPRIKTTYHVGMIIHQPWKIILWWLTGGGLWHWVHQEKPGRFHEFHPALWITVGVVVNTIW